MATALVPVGRVTNPVIDIVFVPGLSGHWRDTWTGPHEFTFWAKWLADEIPQSRVWSFDYPAAASEWFGIGMALADRATGFAHCLDTEDLGTVPLLFIVHSLGGLVTKQMLRHRVNTWPAAAPPDPILRCLAGIVFFATPHHGSFWASAATRFASIFRPSMSVPDLESGDRNLAELNYWFRTFVTDRKLPLKVFAETQPAFKIGLVVDQTSADPGIPGTVPVPLDADHMSICKFTSIDDTTYRSVCKFVRERIADRRPTYADAVSGGVSTYMGLDNAQLRIGSEVVRAEPEDVLSYRIRRRPDSLQIYADLPYATEFNRGGPIKARTWQWSPFSCSFPALDFKIANNGPDAVFVTEAELEFEYSRPRSFPLLVFREGARRSIVIVNEGSGPAQNVRLRFNFAPAGDEPDFSDDYLHEVMIGDIYTDVAADLDSELKKIGSLYSHEIAKRIDESAKERNLILAAGEVSWLTGTAPARNQCKFSTNVYVGPLVYGLPAPPSCVYDLRLRTNDDSYRENVAVSQSIKPGEVDRFQIVLFCDTPTEHQFKVLLRSTAGTIFTSPNVKLEMLVPSSAKHFGRARQIGEGADKH